jgi:hypothetical protein
MRFIESIASARVERINNNSLSKRCAQTRSVAAVVYCGAANERRLTQRSTRAHVFYHHTERLNELYLHVGADRLRYHDADHCAQQIFLQEIVKDARIVLIAPYDMLGNVAQRLDNNGPVRIGNHWIASQLRVQSSDSRERTSKTAARENRCKQREVNVRVKYKINTYWRFSNENFSV